MFSAMLEHVGWQVVSGITKENTAFSSGSKWPVSLYSTAARTQISGSFNINSTKIIFFYFLLI